MSSPVRLIRMALGGEFRTDGLCDRVKSTDHVHRAGGDRAQGHAVDHARLGLLRQREGPLMLQCRHALGPVGSHAGQEHADGGRAESPGTAFEQHVHRGTLVAARARQT
jgi:hypothetical protein